ncbi:MAG: hypothetical protein K0V04_02480 [Deltaproteobacteria bacterium]|nr:hypothetical protein [Deltaproteobacteria bacterium]
MTSDPTRLLEDPSVVASMRGDLLSAAEVHVHGLDVASGLAQLQAATATTAVATGAGMSAATKIAVGLAVTVGAVALWAGLREPAPSVASTTSATISAPISAPVVGSAVKATPTEVAATEIPPAAVPEPPAVAVTPVVEEPEAVVAKEPVAVGEPSDAAAEEPATRKASRAVRPASPSSFVDEAKLVAKARAQLTNSPAKALELAKEAERTFPRGHLVEERRAIAIRALVALGRHDEARRRAKPFLARYGRGAHAAAVRRALGDAG